MLTSRIAISFLCLAATPTLAATCNLTIVGRPVLDDETCTVVGGRGSVHVRVEDGSTVDIRRSIMRARLAPQRPDPLAGLLDDALGDYRYPSGRRAVAFRSLGQVVTSSDSDDRTCYFNQKATLCVDR